jgi:hypothetical protein
VCGQAVVETAALIRERRPPFGASADAAREWRELIEAAFRSTRRAFGTVLQYLAAADGRFESPGAPIPGNEIDARLFATTLGLVIVGSEFLVSGAIGTSFVVAQHFDELHLVDSPWGFRGERRSESFITQPNAIEVGRFSYLWDDGLRAVILGTDGLANTAVRESGDGWYVADGEKLRRLLADAASRNSTSLRNSETLRQAAVDDDATAVLILASRKRA